MSNPVSVIAFSDDRRIWLNIQFNLGGTWHSSRPTVSFDPIQIAITIRKQESRGRSLRMPSFQVPILTDDELDMLRDEIDTASQLDELRLERASETRIDFDDHRATLRPPEFNVRWPPAKAKSIQASQGNFDHTLMLIEGQRGRKGRLPEDEMRWGAEVNADNAYNLISHYLDAIKGTSCEFFDEYSRRGRPNVLCAQQISRMFG
ncbi:hypothetical protein A9174_32225 [Mesorhizobium loti NZP2037]|nr:hypothetical protein A9174_32225 [Mesorhizobium loti NZP2037]OBP77966.1 hypothetical protein BAE41_30915 [Mesorhizobium loti]